MTSRLPVNLIALLMLGTASVSHASTVAIAPDNTWHAFDVDDFSSASGGLEWIDLNDGSALTYNFTTAGNALLTIVDAGFAGDRFQVLDNGVSLGLTSTATNTYPASVGLNFDSALSNANYSYATYLLSAGTHNITGLLVQSALDGSDQPLNATVGGLRVAAAPVPLPASLLLLLSGSGMLGFMRRRNANITQTV